MKIYLRSPLPVSRHAHKLAGLTGRLEALFQKTRPVQELMEKLFTVLQPIFPLDMLLVLNPAAHAGFEHYHIWPPQQSQHSLPVFISEEQGNVILNSAHKRICCIGDQDDHAIVISLLRNHFKNIKFSLLHFRDILEDDYAFSFTLIARRSNAYTEAHVALLLHLMDTVMRHGRAFRVTPASNEDDDPPLAEQHLSLAQLPGMRDVLTMIWKISRQNCPVLLLGETGTGKEVAADAIHQGSARRTEPFVKMNCGNIPDTLIDSELFGHERGAFTGAVETVKGKFERADRGMLLLDELGELPLTAQTRLLRVLQEGVIERVGGSTEIPVDVRILAATHRDLPAMAEAGTFRQDLLYRLNIFPIYIPALRERPEDIPLLLDFFIRRECLRQGIEDPPRLAPSDLKALCSYPWPGNIRELQHAVDRALILWDGGPARAFRLQPGDDQALLRRPSAAGAPGSGSLALDDVIRQHIRKVMAMTGGRITGKGGAADLLAVNPGTLRARMKKLGLL